MMRCKNLEKSVDISFIIPAYNVEDTIKECVESIVNQAFGNVKIEIIIVNDGSTDRTRDVCNKLVERYDCVYLLNKKNGGVSTARNCGIQQAKGNWIMFIDGDDGLLQNTARYLHTDGPEDIILYSYTRSKEKRKNAVEEFGISTEVLRQMVLNRARYIREIPRLSCIDGISNWTCCGKLYRRETIISNRCLFPEGITHGEDMIFNYQVCSAARSVRCVTAPVYYYRLRCDSVTKTFNPKRLKNTRALLEELKRINPAVEHDPDYLMFVYNRLFTCCKHYFSSENKTMSLEEKREALKQLCEEPDYRECIKIKAFRDLSTGFRTRLYEWVVLRLLKSQKYGLVIKLFQKKEKPHGSGREKAV